MDAMKNLVDVQGLVDDEFQQQVMDNFQNMNRLRNEGLDRFFPKSTEEDFEEII